jgi:hypothetical protein
VGGDGINRCDKKAEDAAAVARCSSAENILTSALHHAYIVLTSYIHYSSCVTYRKDLDA